MARVNVRIAQQAFGKAIGRSRVGMLGGRQIQPATTRGGIRRIIGIFKDHPELSAYDRETIRMLDTNSETKTVSTDRIRSLHKNVLRISRANNLPKGIGLTLFGRKPRTEFFKSLTPQETEELRKKKMNALQTERDRRVAIQRQMIQEAAQREAERQRAAMGGRPSTAPTPEAPANQPLSLGAIRSLSSVGGPPGAAKPSISGAPMPAGPAGPAPSDQSAEDAAAPPSAKEDAQTAPPQPAPEDIASADDVSTEEPDDLEIG